jgi:hypothetical protein
MVYGALYNCLTSENMSAGEIPRACYSRAHEYFLLRMHSLVVAFFKSAAFSCVRWPAHREAPGAQPHLL